MSRLIDDPRLNVPPPKSCLCRGAGTVSTPTRNVPCPRCHGYGHQPPRIECERHRITLRENGPCLLCVFEAGGTPQVRSLLQLMAGVCR
jgi:hypothetical protein